MSITLTSIGINSPQRASVKFVKLADHMPCLVFSVAALLLANEWHKVCNNIVCFQWNQLLLIISELSQMIHTSLFLSTRLKPAKLCSIMLLLTVEKMVYER